MNRTIRWALWRLLAATTVACAGGEETPGKDTAPPEPSPADVRRPAVTRPWTWDRRAGTLFAIPGEPGEARLVNPTYSSDQILDSLAVVSWADTSTSLELIAGGSMLGRVQLADVRIDAVCVGWPVGRITAAPTGFAPWSVAFEPGRVEGIAFDSLPVLAPRDSAAVTTSAARAASRLPDDTSSAFRGRPFVVRQASRFATGDGGGASLVEIVRLVPQEANPQQEQIVMILEAATPDPAGPASAFHVRSIGLEESLASLELLAVVRVQATGRVALLLRREREGGFFLQWIERIAPGRWAVTWESALDSC